MRISLLVLLSLTLTCLGAFATKAVTKPPGIALLTAAQKGKKGRLSEILLRENLDINYTEKYGRYRGYTALMWAAEIKHHGIVQKLLEMDANVNHKSYFDETAIYIASKRGSLKIVKTLLKYGANPNIPTVVGFTALLQATWNRYPSIVVELLKKGADPNYQSIKTKYFALYLAARQNDINIVLALLQANASVNLQTSWDQTPIMKAALYGHAPLIHDLVKYGAEVDLQDNRGNTALIWASKRGHIPVITKLIQAGADPFIQDYTGRTSFQWAVRNGDTLSMEELLKNPCSGNSPRKFGICQRSLSRIGTTIAHEVSVPSPSTPKVIGTVLDDTLEEVTLSTMEPITATETTETTTPTVDVVSPYFVIRCSSASLLVPEFKIVILSWFFQWQGVR